MNVSNTIRQHYLFDRDQKRVSLAQFLRDSLSRYSFSNLGFGPSLSGASGSSVVGRFAACVGL